MSVNRRICLALVLCGSSAFAQTGDARVTAILRRGVELRQLGRDEAALQEFQRAYQLAQEPRVVAQVALAEQALGHWVDASNHIEVALASHTDPWVQRNRTSLEQARQEIERHVGRLQVTGGVTGAEVFVNGDRIATLPMGEVTVLAGPDALEVRADGFVAVSRTVQVAAGRTTRERVTLVASLRTGEGAAERRTPRRSGLPEALSVAHGSVAVGSVSGIRGLSPLPSPPVTRCVPRNRPVRVLAEIGGFYLGALVSALPVLAVLGSNGFDFTPDVSIALIPTTIAATFTGSLGAWGAGQLLGGDGGYGWTYLGVLAGTFTIVTPYYTAGMSAAAGAVIGFESSTGPQCNRSAVARMTSPSPWWMLSPSVEVSGGVSRFGVVFSLVL